MRNEGIDVPDPKTDEDGKNMIGGGGSTATIRPSPRRTKRAAARCAACPRPRPRSPVVEVRRASRQRDDDDCGSLPVAQGERARADWTIILGMAYDEDLADRIRELIAGEPDVTEQRMFGGLVFLVGGNMSVAAGRQGSLVVRVDPEDADAFLANPHTQPFVMGGRPVQGRVRVDAEGVRTKRQLEHWVRRSVAYARSLPSKQ